MPYVIFSTFHAMGYIRKVILPVIFHPVEEEPSVQMIQQRLKQYSDNYYGSAMRYVAQIEVVLIMGRLLLGLVFGLQVVAFIAFTLFLRFRYDLSSYTRQVFKDIRVFLDRKLVPPTSSSSIPPIITNCYLTTRDIIIRYGPMGSLRQQAQ
jgi:peptidoglycan hydrolase-like protein with peptidoglycan-binding domain